MMTTKSSSSPISEVLSSLTDNVVERSKDVDQYLQVLNNKKSVPALIWLLTTNWNSFVAERARSTGAYVVDLASVSHDRSPLTAFLDDKSLDKHMDQIGAAENAIKVQVRKSGKGFTLSIPILNNIGASKSEQYAAANFAPSAVARAGRLYPVEGTAGDPLLPHGATTEQTEAYYKFLKSIVPASAWADFIDPSKPVDFAVEHHLGKNIGFDPSKEEKWLPQPALNQFASMVKGFQIVGPGMEFNVDWIEDPKERAVRIASARTLHVLGNLELPQEVAQFISQSEKPKGGDIFVWLMAWMKYWVGSTGGKVEAVRSLSSIKRSIKEQPKARTNADGLMISPEGYIYYIPTVDKVEEYESAFEEFVDHDGVFTLAHVGGEKPKKLLPREKVVYTDWKNNKLAYSDSIGMLQVLDLDGWQPVNPTQARNLLDLPLVNTSRTKIKYILGHLRYTIVHQSPIERKRWPAGNSEALVELGIAPYAMQAPFDAGDVLQFCNKLGTFASGVTEQLKQSPNYLQESGRELYDKYGPGLKDLGIHDLMTFPAFRWVAEALESVYDTFHGEARSIEKHLEFIEQRAPVNGMAELGLLIALVKYGRQSQYMELVTQDKQLRRPYTHAKQPGYEWDPKPVHYLAEDRALLPHQCRIDGVLVENEPEWTILAADAGGGKTGMGMRYVNQLMTKGKIKRPLIAMPGQLIKNYIEENVYFYNGKFNMVVLNSNTMMVYGEDGLAKLVAEAPPNTIYLTDFAFLSNHHRNRDVYYGAGSITTNLNVEFLLHCGIDFLGVDESHQLRNEKATKTMSARKLALGIKHKMLMTGTFINNNLGDTAGQYALLDPSLFGNRGDFVDEFGDVVHGQKVITWKEDAEKKIKDRISSQCMMIEAKRKEWGAALPHLVENLFVVEFHQVNQEWYTCYKAILEVTLEEIKRNKALASQMEEDEVDELDLAAALNPYLARLEAFMVAPNADPLAAKLLKGEQIVGPKVKATVDIVHEHMQEQNKGKILVFVNQHVEADAVYNNLPPDLKRRFIRYHAETKDRDLARFKKDPNYIGLIGVEDSLGTGLNLQYCSRLIRLNTRWNPGDLEQANARLWRPNPKEPESARAREVIIDTVIVDFTIDVTKFSRLVSKILSKTKFDEAHNPKYDSLESLPIIKMNLETIQGSNSVQKHLSAYVEEYSKFKAIYTNELQEWKERYKDTFKLKPIEGSGPMEGGQMMRTVPYIPEMFLPATEKLGMVRYSDYVDAHAPSDMEDGMRNLDTTRLWVHSEFGDGEIKSMTDHRVTIKLVDGTVIKGLRKLKTFILPAGKPKTPIKLQLAAHLELPLSAKSTAVQPEKFLSKRALKEQEREEQEREQEARKPKKKLFEKPVKEEKVKPEKKKAKVEKYEIDMNVESIFDQLAITVPVEGLDDDARDKLAALGYKESGPYMFASFKTKQQLNKWVEKAEQEYEIHPRFLRKLELAQRYYNKNQAFNASSALSSINMPYFWRMKSNKAAKNEIRPYAAVLDGDFHIILSLSSQQPANRQVPKKIRVPGVTWHTTEGEMIQFFGNKTALVAGVKKLIESGVVPSDMEEVKQAIKDVRIHSPSAK
jgi:hypothetical protein